MKYYCYGLIALLAIGSVCLANPVKRDDDENDMERLKRQMKGDSGLTATAEQTEVKFLGGPMLSPVNAAGTGALQVFSNKYLQNGQPNGFALQGSFNSLPGLGINGGLNGINGQAGFINPIIRYPNGYELYPQNIYNNGIYPNIGGIQHQVGNGIQPLGNLGSFGALENAVDLANLPGLNSPLAAQVSQPFPLVPGYYPQMGYSPAYQNFQG